MLFSIKEEARSQNGIVGHAAPEGSRWGRCPLFCTRGREEEAFLCGDPGTGEAWISELNGAGDQDGLCLSASQDCSLSHTAAIFNSEAVSACRKQPQLGLLTVNLLS